MKTPTYNHFVHQIYGLDRKAQAAVPAELAHLHGTAVLLVAASDGKLSVAELDYWIAYTIGLGTPPEVAEQWRSFNPSERDLTDVFRELRAYRDAAMVLYDAIKVASVDGYHDKERTAVRKAAAQLRIDGDTVQALEGLVQAEIGLRLARVALLTPGAVR